MIPKKKIYNNTKTIDATIVETKSGLLTGLYDDEIGVGIWHTTNKFTIICSHGKSPEHSHSYTIEATLIKIEDELKEGMIKKFSDIEKIVNEEIEIKYNHKNLDTILGKPITLENMARLFYKALKTKIPELYSIRIWEDNKYCAEYKTF